MNDKLLGGAADRKRRFSMHSGIWRKAFLVLFFIQICTFFVLAYYASGPTSEEQDTNVNIRVSDQRATISLHQHQHELEEKQKILNEKLKLLEQQQHDDEQKRLGFENRQREKYAAELQKAKAKLDLERAELLKRQEQLQPKSTPVPAQKQREQDVVEPPQVNLKSYAVGVNKEDGVCLQLPIKSKDYGRVGMFDVAVESNINEALQYHLTSAPNCMFDEPTLHASMKRDKGGFCFPERNGGGAASADFDNDGLVDVIVTSYEGAPFLFRNLGHGKFENVAKTHLIGLPNGARTNGAAFADVNNDGHVDLVLTGFKDSPHFLFINNGKGVLIEEGEKRGARVVPHGEPSGGGSIAVGDFDNDGWLDLFYCEWLQDFLRPGYSEKKNHFNSRLLRNKGNGYFEDVTEKSKLDIFAKSHSKVRNGLKPLLDKILDMKSAGLANTAFTDGVYSFGANFIDLDRDGFLDLAITGDFYSQMLFWNNGDGTFTEGSEAAGIGEVENPMGSTFADVDGDGLVDWLITSIYDSREKDMHTSFGVKGNFFFRNNGNRTFSDWTKKIGVSKGAWSWGAALFDADNDGDIDAFISNGFFMSETTYEDTFNISPSRLWINQGLHKPWEDIAVSHLHPDGQLRQGRGVLLMDFDRDGSMDVLVVNNAERPYLYHNKLSSNHDWIQLEVKEKGGRAAVGAEVTVFDGGKKRTSIIGQQTGFQGQSEPIVHFGFGESFLKTPIEKIEIFSPSTKARKVLYNVPRNHRVLVSISSSSSDSPSSYKYCDDQVEKNVKSKQKSADDSLKFLPELAPMSSVLEDAVTRYLEAFIKKGRQEEWRSFDGVGNNVDNQLWGAANTPLARRVENGYMDKISIPSGGNRPSPREISNQVCAEPAGYSSAKESPNGLSDLASHFGQLIAHDTDHTTPMANTVGEEYFPISVPKGDPIFDTEFTGEEIIRFRRSIFDPNTGYDRYNPRQQKNKVTAFVDASVVYGSDATRADHLRMHQKGLLKISEGNNLPRNEHGDPNDNPLARDTQKLFLAGDARANVQPGIFALHTLFHREHNYLARHLDRIATTKLQVTLTDDELFYLARRLLIAEYQSVTYNEYLPSILGLPSFPKYGGYSNYDATLNPSIFNTFSTAAFRFGHSQANNMFPLRDVGMMDVYDTLHLNETYFRPDASKVESLIRGMLFQKSRRIDVVLGDNLRNHLFGKKSEGGVDLAALNIQRGRDHGLNDFNTIRKAFQLEPLTSFEDFESFDPRMRNKLKLLYKNDINNIDAFIGMLSEKHEDNSEVGKTMWNVILEQFRRLKTGDRFFYDTLLPEDLVNAIHSESKMISIIKRHTPIEANVYPYANPFYVPEAKAQHRDRRGRRPRLL